MHILTAEDRHQQAAARQLEAALVPQQPRVLLRKGDGGLAAGKDAEERQRRVQRERGRLADRDPSSGGQ